MTTVQNSPISDSLLATMNPSKNSSKSTAADAQDRFMTLLVTQMKNQDPLNPLDNAQVTSQLAQLSTVTGIDKLNGTLESLMGSYQQSQSLQAASMIGHGVLVPGSSLELLPETGAYLGVDLGQSVDSLQLTIKDATGRVVDTVDTGSHDLGVSVLHWDGVDSTGAVLPPGQYKFEMTAMQGGQKVTTVAPLSFGSVSSVSTGAQGVKLNVPGIGTVDMNEVRQIL
ncbi:MAG: flgD [Paucimonas sp.]|jgi:flagellar basal-body rod modification protein FlgD|nr:flgD [Paucimonas sp.]